MKQFTAASIAEITCEEGPPENSWGGHVVWMRDISWVWAPIAINYRGTRVGNLYLLYLLYAGGSLGLTVMTAGLAMAGAGARVKEGSPRIGLCVAAVGLLIAASCAVPAVILDDSELVLDALFGGRSDAAMVRQELWLLGGFVGFNLIVVGLVTAGVLVLTRQRGKSVSSPGELCELPVSQLRETTWPIMARQGWYVAVVGFYMSVCCALAIFARTFDEGFGSVPLYAGAFVGLVVIVVGLAMLGVAALVKGSGR